MTGANDKAWRTLQAELLLAGYHADLLEDDQGSLELIVTRWTLTRRFTDLSDARAWTNQVLGHHTATDRAGVRHPSGSRHAAAQVSG